MKPSILGMTLAAMLGLAGAGSAQATTCYIVFDRNDNVIYQDIFPPVDMSVRGTTERDAMRRRGEYLMFVDAERCPQVEFVTGRAGETKLDFARTTQPSPVPPPPAAGQPMIAPSGKR